MSKRNHRLFLYDILDCIDRIDNYTKDIEKDSFMKNQLISDAVVRNMEIIGEAAKNLPPEIKEEISSIPWRNVIGFRNIVIHEYFYVDLANVWYILKNQLPVLKDAINKYINDNPESNPGLFNHK